MRAFTKWRWHLDEVYVKIGGEMHYLWRAVDHEGEVFECYVTKTRDKAAALSFIKRAMKRYGRPQTVVTDGLRSYPAAMGEIGNLGRQEVGRWLNNRAENSHLPFPTTRERDGAIPTNEDTAEVQLGSRPGPQPLQPGTASRRQRYLPRATLGRPGRLAGSHELDEAASWGRLVWRRRVSVRLTAPRRSAALAEWQVVMS